ncbi:Thiol-disulfide isomerase or thioredoxin [Bryocella elongata]|uniref:Thiol-disulfide isomerase or thioredoxin n=1 Tax=Bryocella elongata TaxID=863522 RepID=A0A1H5TY71_9BACT|nr:TlpA disulfide reductase family protein [Bryocella elongata]SEF67822.1 Thiol-disulfide isomerase or thioredoxin [Bryocella elongata]
MVPRHASRWLHLSGFLAAAGLFLAATGCDRTVKPGQLDQVAPTFAVNDGINAVDLTQLHGKVVVLSFWATWCGPCIEEMPSLEKLQRDLPDVHVVGIASQQDPADYRAWLLRHPITIFSVFDAQQKSNALYGSFRFPETYVIDKSGMIRRKFIGPQNWASPEIESYLKGLAG